MRVIVKEAGEWVEVKTEDRESLSKWPKLVGVKTYKAIARITPAPGLPTVITFGFIDEPGVYHVIYEPL